MSAETDGEENVRVYCRSENIDITMEVGGENVKRTHESSDLYRFEIPPGSTAVITISSDVYDLSDLKMEFYVPYYGGEINSELKPKRMPESESGNTAVMEVDFSPLGSEKSVQLWPISEGLLPEPGPTLAEKILNMSPVYVPAAGLIFTVALLVTTIRFSKFETADTEADE